MSKVQVSLEHRSGLFLTCESINWAAFTQDSDWSYAMHLASKGTQKMLVPTSLINSPKWQDGWATRKVISLYIHHMLVLLALPVETVRRFTEIVITDPNQNPYDGLTDIQRDVARTITLAVNHGSTGVASMTLDDFYKAAEGIYDASFEGVVLTTEGSDTLVADITDVVGIDMPFYDYDHPADTMRSAVVDNKSALLFDMASLVVAKMLHSSRNGRIGPSEDLNTALAPDTALGLTLRCAAQSKAIKVKFKIGASVTQAYNAGTGNLYADVYTAADADTDPLIGALTHAMATTPWSFATPSYSGKVSTSELVWATYALDKCNKTKGSVLPLYVGDKKYTLGTKKIVKKYTRSSPSGIGCKYCFVRKVDGEKQIQPSFAQLDESSITRIREFIQSRSVDNCYAFKSPYQQSDCDLIYTDSVTGRSVYSCPAEKYVLERIARPLGSRTIRMVYKYESASESVKGSMPVNSAYNTTFSPRIDGTNVYLVTDTDGTLLNYGLVDMNTYRILDLKDELSALCDQLTVVLEANAALREPAVLHGDVTDTSPTSSDNWLENIWNLFKSHPLIALIIIVLLIFAVLKYVIPSFTGGKDNK